LQLQRGPHFKVNVTELNELEAEADRADKQHCSNACGMRAYRKRKGKR